RASWLESLKPDAMQASLRYRNLQGQEFETPLWQMVQHVANHSTYHRGQLVTMFRQLGAKAVSTDLIAWDRERAAKG
ncbi:MAG TPA: DinB family protein, partial [Vicinamibacteria bacterium]|nr:DinB family protein [Vicinamibacteria bacterium]